MVLVFSVDFWSIIKIQNQLRPLISSSWVCGKAWFHFVEIAGEVWLPLLHLL